MSLISAIEMLVENHSVTKNWTASIATIIILYVIIDLFSSWTRVFDQALKSGKIWAEKL